ncbi:NAD(P)/FAD-dependent oxidoreductase [Nocardioides panacisoli]|uniref:flavin-containing monooxygenase n=1 Tax=Nocardioides panacisoli TaxID=627624 RepID=UPI001C62BEDD|nr:NAD(P)/FAD-dependent oxidoreductase [Nocardioides panacisoli]QYJ05028.1 NAD(P)/FAD-dependent oxidoreductase [Nocardioides panacisoli]
MAPTQQPRVLVIGAGFGGLATARELLAAGHRDVTVLERADDVGGVWRDNTYPDAACDVPSTLYSWSWAPKHDWSHRYAKQPEILDYIRTEADRAGLRDLVRTRSEVAAVSWDDTERHWVVTLTDGTDLVADVVVSAVGQLSRPAVPAIPGLDDFAGPSFHSARWDHTVPLRGKRIGVIGTGASAIQFVPGIVDDVAAITVFQRSAPYVVPKPDRAYRPWHTTLFTRAPGIHHVVRRGVFHLSEQLNKTLDDDGRLASGLRRAWQAQLRRQVKDPALRAKLVPDYPLGCKRLLFSNDWYPALAREHVEVVTEDVTAVEGAGVRTGDGTLHECDVLILGTGFAATDFLAPMEVTGRGGRRLDDAWDGGARAHLGMTVPGFPNFFCVYGPNTNLGGSSIIGMLEAQAGYIRQAVDVLAARARTVEVRPEVADGFDSEVQGRLARSVWAGCTSWYTSASGRVTTNWPGPVAEYQRRTATFAADEYAVD